MNITTKPLKGTPNTIVGRWTLEHGNSSVEEIKEFEITDAELQIIAETFVTLSRAVDFDRERCTEEYMGKVARKHGISEDELGFFHDVIRTDARFEQLCARIVKFQATKYDANGDPHVVLFNGSDSL